MSSLFKLPLQGELLWSALSRFKARFPSIGSNVLLPDLFGQPMDYVAVHFPKHLNALAANLAHLPAPDGVALLKSNTMYPFAAPFLKPTTASLLRAHILDGQDARLQVRAATAQITCNRAASLRCCPKCISDDIEQIGVPAWRCIHQVAALKICPIHHCLLREFPFPRLREFVPLSDIADAGPAELGPVSRLQDDLAKNVLSLAENTNWEVGPQRLLTACKVEIQKTGRDVMRRDAHRKFAEELRSAFSDRELEDCGAAIGDVERRNNWVAAIFRGTSTVPSISRYSAVCSILGISISTLLKTAAEISESEHSPWPCVSTGLPCSSTRVIRIKKIVPGKGVYRFECPHCRTAYVRRAPLVANRDGTFDFDILPGARDPSAFEGKVEERRQVLQDFLSANADIPYRQFPEKIKSVCEWLRLHDPEPLPAFAPRGPRRDKRNSPSLVSRDGEVASLIQSKTHDARQHLTKPGAPRITAQSVIRFFAPMVRIQQNLIPRMPQTAGVIATLIESLPEFQKRRVDQLVDSINGGTVPTPWMEFYRKFYCYKLTPEHYLAVRSAYECKYGISRKGRIGRHITALRSNN